MAGSFPDWIRQGGWVRKIVVVIVVALLLLGGAGMLIEGLY